MPNSSKRTIAVGITGGIGSGKTEVSRIFELLGAKILYADTIAKEITNKNDTVRSRIKKEFGNDSYLPDGTLDRKGIAKLVFQSEELIEKLNAIIHPFVLEQIKKEIQREKAKNTVPLLGVEAALIYEVKSEKMFDYVIVVDAPEEQRIERIVKRDGATRTEVLNRIRSQLLAEEKTKKAEFVIQNTGDFSSLERTCSFIYNLLVKLSKV
jgi:dephospho-CoA kinase